MNAEVHINLHNAKVKFARLADMQNATHFTSTTARNSAGENESHLCYHYLYISVNYITKVKSTKLLVLQKMLYLALHKRPLIMLK